MKRLPALLLAVLLLAGCIGNLIPYSSARPRRSAESYCDVAARYGWCSEMCGRKQPEHCHPAKLIGRSADGVFCTWKGRDGSLFFSLCPPS